MKSSTEKIALCGILTALSVVILFVASVSGIGTFAGPIIASLLIPIVASEYDKTTAFFIYLAVSILALILMPDRELVAAYICFAWYPTIRDALAKRVPIILAILLKLLIYILVILNFSQFVVLITGIHFGEGSLSATIIKILFVAGAITFLLLDKIYEKLIFLWVTNLRKNLLRK